MQVREIMTPNPACCTADTPLQEVARMMVDNDCGETRSSAAAPIERSSASSPIVTSCAG